MYIACIVLIFIASILLIMAVLSQNPKGGMAANFGASNQVMGVRQTADFLEKSTWGLALSILMLSLVATMTIPKEKISRSRSGIERQLMQERETGGETIPSQLEFPTDQPAGGEGSESVPAGETTPAGAE